MFNIIRSTYDNSYSLFERSGISEIGKPFEQLRVFYLRENLKTFSLVERLRKWNEKFESLPEYITSGMIQYSIEKYNQDTKKWVEIYNDNRLMAPNNEISRASYLNRLNPQYFEGSSWENQDQCALYFFAYLENIELPKMLSELADNPPVIDKANEFSQAMPSIEEIQELV
ncbi:MAG: hypothetical protein K940chlam6_01270 [Chlamydiae bacterium]|nr:hypothetical protein [Chlamydiota bacterium]